MKKQKSRESDIFYVYINSGGVMKKSIITVIIVFIPCFLFGQEEYANNANLKNHHSININSGIKGNSKLSVSPAPVIVDMKTGFIGGLDYGYWFNDEWQIGLSFEIVEASLDINVVNVESNAVVSMLAGVKYYPENLKLGNIGRFYAGIFAGPVMGFAAIEKGAPVVSQNVTETVIGGQLIAGIDLFIARWLKIGPALNYYFMGDFSEITGDNKNFSGFGFVFNAGFVL